MSDLRTQAIRLASTMPKGSVERQALLDVLAAPRHLRPPVPPFTRAEARVMANELISPYYVKEARQWAKHYAREAKKWEREQKSWTKQFGSPDDNYDLAFLKAKWMASAWEQVAKDHGQ